MTLLKTIEAWKNERGQSKKKNIFAINRYIFPDVVKLLIDCKDIAYISIGETKDCIELHQYGNYGHYLDSSSSVLNIDFDDISEDKVVDEYQLKAITTEQAKTICDFIIKNKDKHIICHCRAGKSRSQGIVRAVLDCFPDIYSECIVNKLNPCITPNYEVVRKLKKEMYQFV